MNDFLLSCSSAADLNKKYYDENNIFTIPMRYLLSGKEYYDDGTISPYEFFNAIKDGADVKTTQLNEDELINYFEKLLKINKRILHIELSSGLSGSYNNVVKATNYLNNKYNDVKILAVDSLCASSGMGLLLTKLAYLRNQGKTLEEVHLFAEEHKLEVNHWFFSRDLTYFIKGGRISKLSGWAGTLLHICPLLNMSNEGKLVPRYKIIGQKRIYKTTVDKMTEMGNGGFNYNDECYICHSDCIGDALAVKELCEKQMPALKDKIKIFDIGSTIGGHTGPGTVSLFFWGEKREN